MSGRDFRGDGGYKLEAVLARADVKALPLDSRLRVEWAYVDTYAAYEANVPYNHQQMPGIAGVMLYQLNKEIVAYGAAVREAQRQAKEVRS